VIRHIVLRGERALKTALYAGVLLMLLLNPDESIYSAQEALRLWGMVVVPSLFPYMVLCRILSGHLKRQRIPVGIASILLGFIGGSPSGSAVLSGYSPKLRRSHLLAMCAATGTMSPMFLLGTASSWLPEALSGGMLLTAHIGGAFLTACLFWVTGDKPGFASEQNEAVYKKTDPIEESVRALLQVGGCIVFYSVLAGMICRIPGINHTTAAVIHALMEVSGGMHAISCLPLSPVAVSVLLAAASGFTGISVLSQNHIFLSSLGVKITDLVLIGILRASCSACIMRMICFLAV